MQTDSKRQQSKPAGNNKGTIVWLRLFAYFLFLQIVEYDFARWVRGSWPTHSPQKIRQCLVRLNANRKQHTESAITVFYCLTAKIYVPKLLAMLIYKQCSKWLSFALTRCPPTSLPIFPSGLCQKLPKFISKISWHVMLRIYEVIKAIHKQTVEYFIPVCIGT